MIGSSQWAPSAHCKLPPLPLTRVSALKEFIRSLSQIIVCELISHPQTQGGWFPCCHCEFLNKCMKETQAVLLSLRHVGQSSPLISVTPTPLTASAICRDALKPEINVQLLFTMKMNISASSTKRGRNFLVTCHLNSISHAVTNLMQISYGFLVFVISRHFCACSFMLMILLHC